MTIRNWKVQLARREVFAKVIKDTVDVAEHLKAERNGASERYNQMLLSVCQIAKARYEWKDKKLDAYIKLGLL